MKTEMKRLRFIVNPISGTHNKKAVVELIPKYFPAEEFECQVLHTKYAGHASILAAESAAEGWDVVVAIGGDGTVNEVARALRHTETALGIIPCGSGNGLARHLGIPINHLKAMEILRMMYIRPLDYGTINEHPFFCTCGVGFDAFVSDKFANSGKRGFVSYIENTLFEGIKYKPETYEVEIDGNTERVEAFLIACGNASQYGNNAYITPDASMSDGLMDVTIMQPFSIVEAPQIAVQLFNKTLKSNSHIKSLRCKSLTIHRQNPGVVHYDGDPVICDSKLEIKLIEKGIRIVTNPKGKINTPPLLRIFTDIYTGIQDEMKLLRNDIDSTNRKIKAINKDLLNKLRG